MSKANTEKKAATESKAGATDTNTVTDKNVENVPQKLVIVPMEKLAEIQEQQKIDEQRKFLQEIIDQKKPEKDAQFLLEALGKENLRPPSEKLQAMFWKAKQSAAQFGLSGLDTKQEVINCYNAAKTDGYTPQEARKLVWIFIADKGRFFSDRTIRNYLPAEAKNENMAHPELHEKAKTPEEKEGLTQLYCTIEMVREIAKFAELNQGCLLFAQGKSIVRVKKVVTIEEKGSDGKFHKVQRSPEAVSQTVKVGGKKKK